MNFLLVGLGSIGRKHLTTILRNYPGSNVVVVDPLYPLGQSTFEGSSYVVLPKISQVCSPSDVAIVANWGPDHFTTFLELVEAGFRRILIEKPLADSLYEVNMIRELCFEHEIVLTVNHSWHFEEIPSRIQNLSSNLDLGSPVMITVVGGARCLSTAGSHFIHLANQLFGAVPKAISGLGATDFINPRNPKLSFYEGAYSFSYPDRQYLSISFSNHSSIAGSTTLFWKDAIGYLSEDSIEIYERERTREYFNVITRYGNPEQLIFKGEIPKNEPAEFKDVFDYLVNVEFANSKKHLNSHINSAKTLIQAVLATHLGIHTSPHMEHDESTSMMKLGIS